MTLWRALQQAWLGWVAILRQDAQWRTYFALTLPGLVTALALFALAAFISIILSALSFGVPTLDEFLGIMFVQSLSILALLGGALATRFAVPQPAPLLPILVPGIYALIAYLLLGTVVSLFSGVAILLLWVGSAYLLYRLGRVSPAWTRGVSAAFSGLTVVLLAALPMTLYMLMGTASAPAL